MVSKFMKSDLNEKFVSPGGQKEQICAKTAYNI
jgi:hypothetical protein